VHLSANKKMASLKKRFVAEPETLFQGVILFKNSSRKNWRSGSRKFFAKIFKTTVRCGTTSALFGLLIGFYDRL